MTSKEYHTSNSPKLQVKSVEIFGSSSTGNQKSTDRPHPALTYHTTPDNPSKRHISEDSWTNAYNIEKPKSLDHKCKRIRVADYLTSEPPTPKLNKMSLDVKCHSQNLEKLRCNSMPITLPSLSAFSFPNFNNSSHQERSLASSISNDSSLYDISPTTTNTHETFGFDRPEDNPYISSTTSLDGKITSRIGSFSEMPETISQTMSADDIKGQLLGHGNIIHETSNPYTDILPRILRQSTRLATLRPKTHESEPTRVSDSTLNAIECRQIHPPQAQAYQYSSLPDSQTSMDNRTLQHVQSTFPDYWSHLEKHEYDEEERFAVVWLRTCSSLHIWREIKRAFDQIFPPGTARRSSQGSTNFPGRLFCPWYPERTITGLECRYYRIRDSVGLKKLRDKRRAGGCEKGREQGMIRKMKIDIVKHWLETTPLADQAARGVTRRENELPGDWIQRVEKVWEKQSKFWSLLQFHGMAIKEDNQPNIRIMPPNHPFNNIKQKSDQLASNDGLNGE